MDYVIFTDSAGNLPERILKEYDIEVVALPYYTDGEEHTCPDLTGFDGDGFYESLRGKAVVTTSLVNPHRFKSAFREHLENGRDVLYVGMSSGISGTHQAAFLAAQQLREEFPYQRVETVDTLAASFGEGLLVIMAAKLRAGGMGIVETAHVLNRERHRMHQVFTVDDLMFLRRGGRVSSVTAVLGTVLGIKPLLKGDEEGRIVVFDKARGRTRSLRALADNLAENIENPQEQVVCIAHGGCPLDAELLAGMIRAKSVVKDILIEYYEPVTGSHVGPGTVALFYFGA